MKLVLAFVLMLGIVPDEFAGLCRDLNNLFTCYAEIETSQLPRYSDRVQRYGTELRVTTHSEKVMVLRNDDRFKYQFRGCDLDAGWCSALKGANEYAAFAIIDLERDTVHLVPTYPIRSPSGQYVALGMRWDLYGSPFLEIRDASNFEVLKRWDDLDPLCRDLGKDWITSGAASISWSGDDQVRFDLECEQDSIPYLAKKTQGEWTLHPASQDSDK